MRQYKLKINFESKEETKNCFNALKSVVALKETDLRHDKIITGSMNSYVDLEK